MKISEVRTKAKEMGLKANGSKSDIVHRIQAAEGNEACFGTRSTCPHMDCCWREDCIQ